MASKTTSIRMDQALYDETKRLAEENERTVTQQINWSVRQAVKADRKAREDREGGK